MPKANHELWGTFAVSDHLRPRAYVAEAILFDRLVLPTPPDGNDDLLEEWKSNGWKPDLQKEVIDILGDLAIPVPWDATIEGAWQSKFVELKKIIVDDVKHIKSASNDTPAAYVSRNVIKNSINNKDDILFNSIKSKNFDPSTDVEAVVGFGSLKAFSEYASFKFDKLSNNELSYNSLFFNWDFIVPEDTVLNDRALLKVAVKLSQNNEFRESRAEFHAWRKKLERNSATPEAALTEMTRCLKTYNNFIFKSKIKTKILSAMDIVSIAAPLADLIYPGVGTVGGVGFGLCTYLARNFVPDSQVPQGAEQAAFIHDSRQAFGWKS